jgi:small GTP-binding protein
MIKKKVCMVGDFAVGKTSLTQRFVKNQFSEKYLTTIGVKIDNVVVGETKLIIWDIAGRDALSPINANYLAGAAGIVMVADGTRPETIESLKVLAEVVQERIGRVPTVTAINKKDDPNWQLQAHQAEAFSDLDWAMFETSAKDGLNVPEMFAELVQRIHFPEQQDA